jgi:beta-xylosidase
VNHEATYLEASDDFNQDTLGLQWQWLGNHRDDFYSLTCRSGYLRLYALNLVRNKAAVLWHSSNVLTQKFVCPKFQAETKLDFSGLKEHEKAGFGIIGGQYAYLAVSKKNDAYFLSYEVSVGDGDLREEKELLTIELEPSTNNIILRIQLTEINDVVSARMAYQDVDGTFIDTGFLFEPSDHTWVGSKIALFAVALDEVKEHGHIDVAYVMVNAMEDMNND